MLSVGVTANRLSVTPAAKPASAARGPDTLPSASASSRLYWSNATNPKRVHRPSLAQDVLSKSSSRDNALRTQQEERTDASLGGVADDERRAPGVPLRAEWWPRQLLALGQPAVQLCSCLGDCGQQQKSRLVSISSPSYIARFVSLVPTANPSTGRGTVRTGGLSLSLEMKIHGRRDERGVHSAGYVIATNRK